MHLIIILCIEMYWWWRRHSLPIDISSPTFFLYATDMAWFYVENVHNIFWSTHTLSIIRYIQYYTFKRKLDHLYNTFFFVSKVCCSMCSVSILVFLKTTEYQQNNFFNSTKYETTLQKQSEGVWYIPQRTQSFPLLALYSMFIACPCAP